MKFTMVALAASLCAVSVAMPATAQNKAPPGCTSCEALCSACVKSGRQRADKLSSCRASCRAWAARTGKRVVYVKNSLAHCGPANYPQC
jgi:hypothetical protein